MRADPSQLLTQLQDIHSAGAPAWWPPAPGWWLLAVGLLAFCTLALRAATRRLAQYRRKKAWLQALEALTRENPPVERPREYLAALNRLFRAVALKAFPSTACARLQGGDWVVFIGSLMPEQADLDCLGALASGPYEPLPEFDAAALADSARTWVRLYG